MSPQFTEYANQYADLLLELQRLEAKSEDSRSIAIVRQELAETLFRLIQLGLDDTQKKSRGSFFLSPIS